MSEKHMYGVDIAYFCEARFEKLMKDKIICIRCGSIMIEIQTCHVICRCGCVYDCSDKGFCW